jgi:integrase
MVSYRTKTDSPKLTFHKGSGLGVVRLDGRDIYLGRFGTAECEAMYHRVLTEWLANGRRLPAPPDDDQADAPEELNVNDVALAYAEFAATYYTKRGRPTTEVRDIRLSIRPLRELFGLLPAKDFTPGALKAVRQAFVDSGLCRNEVNKRTRRLVRMFGWAVEEGMVPAEVHWGLKAVKGLKEGRCGVRESEPVRPVLDTHVDAIRPHVPPQVWAMVQLMRLTGMRPGEVCQMRTIDLDTSGQEWIYTPETHKTEHHGKERKVPLGPRAREILRPWLRTDLTGYLFSPREAMQHRFAERRAARRTRVQPSQASRKKARPKRVPGERYDTRSLYHAVAYGIRRANREAARQARQIGQEPPPPIPNWSPGRLRHNAGTKIRKKFGLDAARAVLGHASPVVTEVYAELDATKAAEVMARIG